MGSNKKENDVSLIGSPEEQASVLSQRLTSLKSATLRAIGKRERLTQPLFWSLFHAELKRIKSKRKEKRAELAKAFDIDWL